VTRVAVGGAGVGATGPVAQGTVSQERRKFAMSADKR